MPEVDAEDWRAVFYERAGFLEFDCHLARAVAEAQALAEMGEPPFGCAGRTNLNTVLPRPPTTRH